MSAERDANYDLSVVIACYQEEGHLVESIRQLTEVLDETGLRYELVFIEDKSTDRTAEVISNLVDNASRHAASQIQIITRVERGEAMVAVHDDGPGIPLARRQEVFGRFVRLDEARSADARCSGLRLAIVAEVVAAHRGDATISESPLGGAAVTIRLPTDQGETRGSSAGP